MSALHPAALFAAVCIVLAGLAAAKHKKPLRSVLGAVLSGTAALGAVNMLAGYTGVSLGLTLLSWFSAVVLGVPGIICLLLLKVIFGLA